MASIQSTRRPGVSCCDLRRAPSFSAVRSQPTPRVPVIPIRRSTSALPTPLCTPTSLRPIHTKPAQTHLAAPASALSPIPEHSPCTFSSGSPVSVSSPTSPHAPTSPYVPTSYYDIPWDAAPFIGLAEVEARRRREALEAGLRDRRVFRPAGVAGKGTHRRAEVPARPQPPAPRFHEFHLRTEVKGAAAQAEVARQRFVKEQVVLMGANHFRARPAPKSLRRGPPVDLTRTSPLRRAALRKTAAGAVDRQAVVSAKLRQ